MPRKKKTENGTVETKAKATKKKAEKVEEHVNPQFSITEMIEWTDEECKEKDKEFQFNVADVRDIFKSLAEVNKNFNEAAQKLNIVKTALSKGLMTGYRIECPHCKREYAVGSMELNRNEKIVCKVCGTEYKEDESITGLEMVTNNSVENIVKDNETVVI